MAVERFFIVAWDWWSGLYGFAGDAREFAAALGLLVLLACIGRLIKRGFEGG